MSEELLQTLLSETNQSIKEGIEKAQSESWKDNVFENIKP